MSKLSYAETIHAAALLGECVSQAADLYDQLSQSEEESDLWIPLVDAKELARTILKLPHVGQSIVPESFESLKQAREDCLRHLSELSEIKPALASMEDEPTSMAAIQRAKLQGALLMYAATSGIIFIFPGPTGEEAVL